VRIPVKTCEWPCHGRGHCGKQQCGFCWSYSLLCCCEIAFLLLCLYGNDDFTNNMISILKYPIQMREPQNQWKGYSSACKNAMYAPSHLVFLAFASVFEVVSLSLRMDGRLHLVEYSSASQKHTSSLRRTQVLFVEVRPLKNPLVRVQAVKYLIISPNSVSMQLNCTRRIPARTPNHRRVLCTISKE
jgi:hypothetical protein